MRKHSLRSFASIALCASLCAGCINLPENSSPEVLRTFSSDILPQGSAGPADGLDPDEILRGFFKATAHPLRSHQAARSYMTQDASGAWEEANEASIIDGIDISAVTQPSMDEVVYRIRGNIVGKLGAGGTYTSTETPYDEQLHLVRDNGQWRIAQAPEGILIDRSAFTLAYRPFDLFFLDPSQKRLVPDRRWVYQQQENLTASLLTLLAVGPRQELSGGVTSAFPAEVSLQVDGAFDIGASVAHSGSASPSTERSPEVNSSSSGAPQIDIHGVSALPTADRKRLIAQVVWTLAAANIRGPYTITTDGADLIDSKGTWNLQDLSEYDPTMGQKNSQLYVIESGKLKSLTDGVLSPVPVDVSQWGRIYSAGITCDSTLFSTIVSDGNGDIRWLVASMSIANAGAFVPTELATGQSFTTPSWSTDNRTVYVVKDGHQILRAVRTATVGNVLVSQVQSPELDILLKQDEERWVSAFKIAPDGVHAALIVSGEVYVGTIETTTDGSFALTHLQRIGQALGKSATDLDWRVENGIQLIIGTSERNAPLWSVDADGSSAVPLSSSNLNAPIMMVAVNGATYYVADSRALLQINNEDPTSQYWREVPGVQGLIVIPVLPK